MAYLIAITSSYSLTRPASAIVHKPAAARPSSPLLLARPTSDAEVYIRRIAIIWSVACSARRSVLFTSSSSLELAVFVVVNRLWSLLLDLKTSAARPSNRG